MKSYTGTKTLKARPLNRGDYNTLKGWTIPADENPADEGYLVEYKDGYVSWSPKATFEDAYTEDDVNLVLTLPEPTVDDSPIGYAVKCAAAFKGNILEIERDIQLKWLKFKSFQDVIDSTQALAKRLSVTLMKPIPTDPCDQLLTDEFNKQRFAIRDRLPDYTLLFGVQSAKMLVLLVPTDKHPSGVIDHMTGVELPIGTIKIEVTTAEELITKLEYIYTLLKA